MSNIIKSHTLQTVREEFNEYVLDDGNILRIKDIIVGFGFAGEPKKDDAGKMLIKSMIQVQQVNAVIPTGNPDTSVLEFIGNRVLTAKDRKEKLGFKPKNESISIYETNEHFLFVRSRLNEVWRTNYKDKNNIPIYHFNSDSALDVKSEIDFAPIAEKNEVKSSKKN